MLFAWGMQRHGQLGIGDIQQPYSTPRPISFLQYVMSYSVKFYVTSHVNSLDGLWGLS